MTQATATTASRAVRQHGGGLVHANPPRTTLRGRHHCTSGGAINRRCEAASIIALAFSAPATLAYPMTGVRRARELSPSLRSQNRPHAQLVLGAKPPLSHNTNGNWSPAETGDSQVVLLYRQAAGHNRRVTLQQTTRRFVIISRAERSPTFDFEKDLSKLIDDDENAANNAWGQWLSQQGSQGLIRLNQPQGANSTYIQRNNARRQLDLDTENRTSCFKSSGLSQLCGPQIILKRCEPRTLTVFSVRPISNQKCRNDCRNGAKRLNPCGGHLTPRQTPGPTKGNNERHSQPQNNVRHIDKSLDASHISLPLRNQNASLNISRLGVHGGAE